MNKATESGSSLASERPPWLVYVEHRISEENEQSDSGAIYFEIVRDFLLAPENDETAVPSAIRRFNEHYIAGFAGEDFGRRQPPEYAAGDILNEISIAIFETAGKIDFTDFRHDRLANFLICLKRYAAVEFNKEVSSPNLSGVIAR